MNIYNKIPVLPLRGLVAFPKMLIHFDVGRSMSIKALNRAMKESSLIFLTAQEDVRIDSPSPEELYEKGTLARIKQIMKLPNDTVRVLVEGLSRAKVLQVQIEGDCLIANVQEIDIKQKSINPKQKEAFLRIAKEKFDEYLSRREKVSDDIALNASLSDDVGYLADHIAQNISVGYRVKQFILEEINVSKRISDVINILDNETEILRLEDDIEHKLKKRLDQNHREYYLREQIKIIKTELGEEDGTEIAEEYRRKVKKLKLSDETLDIILKEISKFERTSPMSPESSVIRNYLDLFVSLPWNKYTTDKLNLKTAEKVLNSKHFGMEKVKERILENLAIRALSPQNKGGVICLVGPPGVGKTSIASSIAKSMGRKFSRISLGGVRDEADIRGHRKTYIASMSGRIINGMKSAQSLNPVILMDEIDKMGSDGRADPSSALLEVFDLEQNSAFRDHYLEIPFDISNVLWITTANDISKIPAPLRDRMEIIEIGSYTPDEKLAIAKKYLLPKQLEKNGIKKSDVTISDAILKYIISGYTRESGVRKLEQKLAEICRKTAKICIEKNQSSDKNSKEKSQKITINLENIETFLGVAYFAHQNNLKRNEIGAVNGLAYTSVGGEILRVEVNILEGTGKIEITGNLGTVMQESVKIAVSYVRFIAREFEINPNFYKENDIHVHFPEGAVPKDGPSAGIAITTALISALTGIPVNHKVAMTGEVSLRGSVMAIGGLREKTMAAYMNGIKKVIIPKQNTASLTDISKVCLENMEFVLVENMQQVIEQALVYEKSFEMPSKISQGITIQQ